MITTITSSSATAISMIAALNLGLGLALTVLAGLIVVLLVKETAGNGNPALRRGLSVVMAPLLLGFCMILAAQFVGVIS